MMDVQPKYLEDRLLADGFDCIVIDDSAIFCSIKIYGYKIDLKCALSSHFPYELPTVYIAEESYKMVAPLPHVNSDFSVCTFDKSSAIPNFLAPDAVVLESIEKAKTIIMQGISGENTDDFYDEFNAYWTNECSGIAESILTISNEPRLVKCYMDGKNVYLADTKEDLDRYLGNVGVKKRYLSDYHDCLSIPLSIRLKPPFPKTNYEFFSLIKRDTAIAEAYTRFLRSKIPRGAFVAFSIKHKDKHYQQLFMHTGISANIDGFRKGHAPVGISYIRDTKKTQVRCFYVDNMGQERLFSRGGVGLEKNISKVCIIGCGSIGGYAAEALSEFGIDKFVLVDNERLTSDNIARHYCGYEYIGKAKAFAVADKLKKHNPNINCDIYNVNGHYFLDKHLDILNSCDLIFVATAATPLEYRIAELLKSQCIQRPVVLIWAEAFLVSGHALILNKPQDIFGELFDESYSFRKKVLLNSEDFQLKEAGCQSTFVPYAAFSLKQFLYKFLDYLMYESIPSKHGNYLCTWCGDFVSAKKRGCQIASEWVDAEKHSFHIKRLD